MIFKVISTTLQAIVILAMLAFMFSMAAWLWGLVWGVARSAWRLVA